MAMQDAPQSSAHPLSREEVLGGMGGRNAKQASMLLLLIETRTVQLLTDSRQAVAPYNPSPSRQAQAQSYLQTLAKERERAQFPTIRDLERYARQWAELVPDNANVRALTAHLVGEKYRIPQRMTPGIRSALGLESAAVQQAYQQLYQQPLRTLYRDQLRLPDRIRWRWTHLAGWLENLSPFWSAFALTLTETVGAGILALPIALAQVGPLAGLVLLLVFGLANLLTLASVTEAITRYGPIRYGFAYFGQMVGDTLGKSGVFAFTCALLTLNLLVSSAYYVGVASALADATHITPLLWAALLFLAILYFLHSDSLNATIASALVIGFVNLTVILILAALALPHIQLSYLSYLHVPGINGVPFEPKVVELIFGIVLTAFFGHTSVGNVAKVVLHRDPSGRTLLWGNVMALLVALLIYCIWLIAINGSIAPATLATTSGTALTPLALIAGPAVHLFGSIFVVLGMGMAALHYSLALFNQMQEWLARPSSGRWLRSAGSRFVVAIVPTTLIFLGVEWALYTQQASFAGPLGLIGALAAPLLAGIFPLLLLLVTRRSGDYVPGVVWRWLGHPLLVAVIYLLFFTGLLAHGLIIWSDPLRRTIALATSVATLVLTWLVLRRNRHSGRTVIEVRQEQGKARFQIVYLGKPLSVPLEIHTLNRTEQMEAAYGELPPLVNLRSLIFHLPEAQPGQLKLWIHQLSAAGISHGVPARCLLRSKSDVQEYFITADQPELLLPQANHTQALEVQMLTDVS